MTTLVSQLDVNPFRTVPAPAPTDGDVRQAAHVIRIEHQESLVTRLIEHQTAKIPSSYFLVAAVCVMGVSLGAEMKGRVRISRFVGMWPGPLLIMGLYNKVVKTFGPR